MNRIENIVDIINKFSIPNLFAISFRFPFLGRRLRARVEAQV